MGWETFRLLSGTRKLKLVFVKMKTPKRGIGSNAGFVEWFYQGIDFTPFLSPHVTEDV